MTELQARGCAWKTSIMTPEILAHENGEETVKEGDIVICGIAACGLRPRLSYHTAPSVEVSGLQDRYLSARDPAALCPDILGPADEADHHDIDAVDGV